MNTSFAFQKPKVGVVPLTSLMDVLTILLVFLLVNYTETPQDLTDNGVRLPEVTLLAATPLDKELADRIPVEMVRTEIRVGKERIEFTGMLPGEIRNRVERQLSRLADASRQKGKPARLLIRAEASLPYRFVDIVLSAAGRQSITDIKLVGAYRGAR